MKKIVIIIISVLLLGGIIGGVYYFKNANKIGADTSYVKITKDPTKGKEISFNYNYTLPSYDEDGKETEVTFSADKELRKGAYLKLYIKEDKGVTSFEEVPEKEVPAKAAEKLN
ncbi:YxeA family protein [Listeria monocytogenes]|uniref:YxeA family protein n=1 Tax=Listeria monocytogenes TaxID=1639 RepID=A0AAN3BQR7_LISMN|nr:YxeA family protein [Listeria monocytogenes]EAD7213048.1 YxeA family protein [Listeria monocytogenes]EAD7603304.1 YxeA family protein [Listeria monocytogenes]EAE0012543.1 YxeA family protein [Listeria monocytogenes]EAE1301954.1 YxeA family protein [Listeria monocytogenes]EAF0970937.1 YxeA family protein [Listeria monocytogenes]